MSRFSSGRIMPQPCTPRSHALNLAVRAGRTTERSPSAAARPASSHTHDRSVTPARASTSSSIKKFPVVARLSCVKIQCAASATISGVRPRSGCAPGMICSAAVAIIVRGHSAFTPIPSGLNSSAIPSTHMLIPNFAIVYAICCCEPLRLHIQRWRQRKNLRVRRLRQVRQTSLRANKRTSND